MQPGERVGALLKADATTAHLLGYGVYDGLFPLPVPGLTHMDNPRITLDDGRVVWGIQCWWGPEERIKELIKARTVVNVTEPLPLEL